MTVSSLPTGSTHTVYPEGFIDDLKTLELGGVGSKAIPNGLRDVSGDKKPFQSYYDQKYYIKDAPRPPAPAPTAAPSSKLSKNHSFPTSGGSPAPSSISSGKEEPPKEKKKKGLFRF